MRWGSVLSVLLTSFSLTFSSPPSMLALGTRNSKCTQQGLLGNVSMLVLKSCYETAFSFGKNGQKWIPLQTSAPLFLDIMDSFLTDIL